MFSISLNTVAYISQLCVIINVSILCVGRCGLRIAALYAK